MPGGVAPKFGCLKRCLALHGGVAATVAGVALHCATKPKCAQGYPAQRLAPLRERQSIAQKGVRAIHARNLQLELGTRKGGEHRGGEGSETFLERKWVLRRFPGAS